ncbi:MAG: hypothetical protein K0U16_07310 [Gammaproteobacteria bacterium]|nr:hypothetical protein [Gammaproteobacteria bacterium]
MARPRPTRRAAAHPRIAPVPLQHTDASSRLKAARARLKGIADEDVPDAVAEARRRVSSAVERQVADGGRDKSMLGQIVANQEEILRRLSSIDSRLTRQSKRIDQLEETLFVEGMEEVMVVGDTDPGDEEPEVEGAPDPAEDPADAETQPLDTPPPDPPVPDLPVPDPPKADPAAPTERIEPEDPPPEAG